MPAAPDRDPTQEYRLERGAMRLLKTLFRPGDVVCLAWKVSTGAGQTRMHHQYRLFEQLVAQHSAGGGPFRQLFKLNAPRVPVGRDQRGAQLFDLRRGSDVYFCVNPLREVADPSTGESGFQRRRTHVAAVRTIGMDMDDGGPAGLARLAEDVADGLLPPPHLVVQTSQGSVGQGDRRRYHQKCHLLWAAADAADMRGGFTVDAAEDLVQQLAPRYGADPSVRSGEHLLRVPGFFNCKPPSDRVDSIDMGSFGSEAREVHILDVSETGLYEPVERVSPADFVRVIERPFEPLDLLPSQRIDSPAVLPPLPPASPESTLDESADEAAATKSKGSKSRSRGGAAVLDEIERARYAERYARRRSSDRSASALCSCRSAPKRGP